MASAITGCGQEHDVSSLPEFRDIFNGHIYVDILEQGRDSFVTVADESKICQWPIDDVRSGAANCISKNSGEIFVRAIDASDKALIMRDALIAQRSVAEDFQRGLYNLAEQCIPHIVDKDEESPFSEPYDDKLSLPKGDHLTI